MYRATVLAFGLAASSFGVAYGHGEKHAGSSSKKSAAAANEETSFGRPGDPEKATRTVKVGMNDQMHFTSGHVHVKQGDTIKFVVTNQGKIMHEMVIGTMKELRKHAEVMKKHPGMEHDEPYVAHVSPGKTETIAWQFTKAGEFHYACLIPGHVEAGMIDRISVARRD